MDMEFHYYINYLIAIRAGFSKFDAYKISSSAQYVDNNTEEVLIDSQDGVYRSMPTHILMPTNGFDDMHEMYMCFHFIPGDAACASPRVDGATHHLATTPRSTLSLKILRDMLSTRNLYLIGIASHAFSDTWAHANFTGTWDSFNQARGLLASLMPSIGHADFLNQPDKIDLVWHDERLCNPLVDNKKKFLEAAKYLLLEYRNFLSPQIPIPASALNNFLCDLEKAIGKNGERRTDERISLYHSMAIKYSGSPIPRYAGHIWRARACRRSFGRYRWCRSYAASDWYLFQEAAKQYKRYTLDLINKRNSFGCFSTLVEPYHSESQGIYQARI